MAARGATRNAVAAVVALAAVGQCVQQAVGSQVAATDRADGLHLLQRWSVHGRLSLFARGRLAFTDRTGDLGDWLRTTLTDLSARLAQAPPLPQAGPRPQRHQQEEALLPQAA